MKRNKAAAIFLVAEAGTVGMSIKSWKDLDEAKKARRDTIPIPAVDAAGAPVIDSATGMQRINFRPRNQNIADRVSARRAHLEDWLAVVVFNHLFSGADAFVAANLSDFDANVQADATARGVTVAARIAWRLPW